MCENADQLSLVAVVVVVVVAAGGGSVSVTDDGCWLRDVVRLSAQDKRLATVFHRRHRNSAVRCLRTTAVR